MPALFTLLGWLEINCGLMCIPTALFVGPHLLSVAIASIGLGIGSLRAANGFRHGAKWARWIGAALCVIVISIAAIGVVQSFRAAQWDSAAVWASIAAFFAAVVAAIYMEKSDYS